MRYGFFHGVEGDETVLEGVLAALGDCDRIFCLGGLFGTKGPVDVAILEVLDSVEVLAGAAERRRASDRSLPQAVRERLRRLPEGSVVDGIAVVPQPRRTSSAKERQATGGAPRLVAPLAVMASAEGSRLWRAAGGLARVEALEGPCLVPVGDERLRIDLGPTRCGAQGPQMVVIDTEASTLELRCPAVRPQPRPQQPARRRAPARRRRAGEERQLLLAV